jgi:hypothetical protein
MVALCGSQAVLAQCDASLLQPSFQSSARHTPTHDTHKKTRWNSFILTDRQPVNQSQPTAEQHVRIVTTSAWIRALQLLGNCTARPSVTVCVAAEARVPQHNRQAPACAQHCSMPSTTTAVQHGTHAAMPTRPHQCCACHTGFHTHVYRVAQCVNGVRVGF